MSQKQAKRYRRIAKKQKDFYAAQVFETMVTAPLKDRIKFAFMILRGKR